jgi:hypothetical protein
MSSYSEISEQNKAVTASYPYQNYIKTPSQMGSSTKGDSTTITNNIVALADYVNVLLEGDSDAQTLGKGHVLGNSYFYNTGGTCTAPDGTTQNRYIYINNRPDGKIPLIPSSNSTYKGLVPGILEDLSYMDPTELLSAFNSSSDCQEITMDTYDINNVRSSQSYYVNNDDIAKYDACWFPNGKNPVTGETCVEVMSTRRKYSMISNDIWLQTYMYGITALSCYLLYALIYKKK